NATGTKTVTLTVNDWKDVSANTSITLGIVDSETTTELKISNIQVTNITQTGATILWETNLPANSRVVYDIISHSDISNASAPNYGYALSTSTTDNSPKVTSHSVSLSGLNPGTRYYFRVISE
ncbi:MAG: fibronectin type III domain-containing protein, partial [Candidatus Paceibacterota bacterium]